MSSPKRRERRRYPRIFCQIPLRIRHQGYDLFAQAHNLSCIGAYCTIDKYIPPFSLVSIILLLPLKVNPVRNTKAKRLENKISNGVNPLRNNLCNVRCKGVVVRTEKNPITTQKYNIAIYFNDIKQRDKSKLSQYVQQYL